MAQAGVFSYREITTQAASWRCALANVEEQWPRLARLFAEFEGAPHIFCGCGSTHYLAQFAAPYFQRITGRSCRGVASSELLLQTDTLLTADEKPLVIALSRSGDTTETILAVKHLKERGARVITVSCYSETGLSAASDITIEIVQGREESLAQTRSFAGMLMAVQAMAAHLAGNEHLLAELESLPDLAGDLIARAEPLAKKLGSNLDYQRITYLGSGVNYGLAAEATVKMKEMSLTLAEPYRFMEFRHGPMSLVDPQHLVVGLLSERTRNYELAVLDDLAKRQAAIAVIANDTAGTEAYDCFGLQAPVSEDARPVLYLPFVQLMAYYRSLAKGLNPDRPRNVVMAIKLEGTEMTS